MLQFYSRNKTSLAYFFTLQTEALHFCQRFYITQKILRKFKQFCHKRVTQSSQKLQKIFAIFNLQRHTLYFN